MPRLFTKYFARKSHKSYHFPRKRREGHRRRLKRRRRRMATHNERNPLVNAISFAPTKMDLCLVEMAKSKYDFIENICLLCGNAKLAQQQININAMLFAVIRCPFLSLLIIWLCVCVGTEKGTRLAELGSLKPQVTWKIHMRSKFTQQKSPTTTEQWLRERAVEGASILIPYNDFVR